MSGFKKLAEVEVVAEPAESANVLIEENGFIKKAPKTAVGGAGETEETITINIDIEAEEREEEDETYILYRKYVRISDEDRIKITTNLTAVRRFRIFVYLTDTDGKTRLDAYVPCATCIKYDELSDTSLNCSVYSKLPNSNGEVVDALVYITYSPTMGLGYSVSDYY